MSLPSKTFQFLLTAILVLSQSWAAHAEEFDLDAWVSGGSQATDTSPIENLMAGDNEPTLADERLKKVNLPIMDYRDVGDLNAPVRGKIDPTKATVDFIGKHNVRLIMAGGSKVWVAKKEWRAYVEGTDRDLTDFMAVVATDAADVVDDNDDTHSEATATGPDGRCLDGSCDKATDQRLSVPRNMAQISKSVWATATKRRRMARFMSPRGVAIYKSGNESKGMCAQATKEALVATGVCTSYPSGDAAATHTTGSLTRSCPGLKLNGATTGMKRKNMAAAIAAAPFGSVIVYSGYAGKRPHRFGHFEIKIQVTQELVSKIRASHWKLKNIRVGDTLYCSDFCRATPTFKATNAVLGIYNMKGT